MRAGLLTYRCDLLAPVESRDEDGQLIQDYVSQGNVWCGLKYLLGGEAVMRARIESRRPAVVTVRASPLTRRITSEWRVRIPVGGRDYEVREDPRETFNRGYLEFLVEARWQ